MTDPRPQLGPFEIVEQLGEGSQPGTAQPPRAPTDHCIFARHQRRKPNVVVQPSVPPTKLPKPHRPSIFERGTPHTFTAPVMTDHSITDRSTLEDSDRSLPDVDDDSDQPDVDRSLIRWFLSLSPRERLKTVQNYASSIDELKNG